MDNLTHTLLGAALAETRLRRTTALAGPALVIGANLPDVDAIAYVGGSDVGLLCRRGITHGVLAMAVWPFLLAAALVAWDRLRGRGRARDPGDPPLRPGALVAVSALGVLSHPLLDLLNTYGVRLLHPFSGRWFYGDALFILDPWAWLLLGGAVFLARARTTRSALRYAAIAVPATALLFGFASIPAVAQAGWILGLATIALVWRERWLPRPGFDASRVATAGLLLFALYVAAMVTLGRAGRTVARAGLHAHGVASVDPLLVSPRPADPFTWDVVATTGDAYRFGTLRWLGQPRFALDELVISRPDGSPAERAALADPSARGIANWLRFPIVEAQREGDGYRVDIYDARFARRRTRGGLGRTLRLGPDLEPRL